MRLPGLMAAVVLVSCQTYDFERVVPLFVAQTTTDDIVASKRLKPNVMLLVDNSGSMLSPTDDTDPDCMVRDRNNVLVLCDSSNPCPSTCPTRSSELKNAMGLFLASSGTIARFGLTVFPTPMTATNGLLGCDGATNVKVGLPALAPSRTEENSDVELSMKAQEINIQVQGQIPEGGTPTAASLDFVGGLAGLNESSPANDDYRDDLVLLLTDGLPNCNGANPNSVCAGSTQGASCDCTTKSCGGDPVRGTCSKGCLDRDATVQKVKELRQRGIRTVVVGFGADLAAGTGPQVLDAMAREGGFPRKCEKLTDAECGGAQGSCNVATKQCTTTFFQAANGQELSEALRKISEGLIIEPCEFTLKATPSDRRYLTVMIDQVFTPESPTTYSYDFGANKVTFLGPLCERLKASTPQHPVAVQFRIVERF